RSIHSEVMTHRKAAKNAGSSRARPNHYAYTTAMRTPWGPEQFGSNKPGMQAGEEDPEARVMLPDYLLAPFKQFWSETHSSDATAAFNEGLTPREAWHFTAWLAGSMGKAFDVAKIHKQVVNRITEPFNSIKVVFTASELNNIWALRDHPDAQPEFRTLARKMRALYDTANFQTLAPGEWHMPYISANDFAESFTYLTQTKGRTPNRSEWTLLLLQMSAARCARVSYKGFDGTTDIDKDIKLFEQLAVSKPVHASPFEHQATPLSVIQMEEVGSTNQHTFFGLPDTWGCLKGWMTHRQLIPDNFVPG